MAVTHRCLRPQQFEPQRTFGLPFLSFGHGATVVVVVVVVVVPPVQAWSRPHSESFWQTSHSSPPLPQALLLVPATQKPWAEQQPEKSVPTLQIDEVARQETPPVPQT